MKITIKTRKGGYRILEKPEGEWCLRWLFWYMNLFSVLGLVVVLFITQVEFFGYMSWVVLFQFYMIDLLAFHKVERINPEEVLHVG